MIRLDKLTAQAANMTRSQAVAAIKKGRVTVDGSICRVPDQKVGEQAELLLDGQPVTYEKYVYLMMDKPAGYLSATEDTRDPSVTELLPEALQKRSLGIVGRLDKDTTGLLLLTDNGELNHRLTSPRYHMDKVYLATLDVPADGRDVDDFDSGMDLGDFTASPFARASSIRSSVCSAPAEKPLLPCAVFQSEEFRWTIHWAPADGAD